MPSHHISDCPRFEKKNFKKTEREMFCCNFVALITTVNGRTHRLYKRGGGAQGLRESWRKYKNAFIRFRCSMNVL